MWKCLIVAVLACVCLSSCVVQHPKYARVVDTYQVRVGMPFDTVNKVLQVQPFALKERTDTTYTYNYKYRVKEVKRVPLVMRRNRGIEVESRFVDLYITYNMDGQAIHLESCNDCSDDGEKENRVDMNTLITGLTTLVTVTVPVVLTLLITDQ